MRIRTSQGGSSPLFFLLSLEKGREAPRPAVAPGSGSTQAARESTKRASTSRGFSLLSTPPNPCRGLSVSDTRVYKVVFVTLGDSTVFKPGRAPERFSPDHVSLRTWTGSALPAVLEDHLKTAGGPGVFSEGSHGHLFDA